MPVKVMVVANTPGILAAKKATTTIPIVMVAVGDPVRAGLVSNLGRPGGNITGFTTLTDPLQASLRARTIELAAKARIPVMYTSRADVGAGGLIGYGVDPLDNTSVPPPTWTESSRAPSPASSPFSSPRSSSLPST